MTEKTALITGGNRGIGLALVKGLLADNYKVTVLCRKSSPALAETDATIIEEVDVTNLESIQDAKSKVPNHSIDLLINNAGIGALDRAFDETGKDSIDLMRKQFEVNALGPIRISSTFIDCLKPSGKICMITSRMGSIEDNAKGGYYGYRMSKAALNAFSKSLSIDLVKKEIPIGIYHPGWVQTDMTNGKGYLTTEECSKALLQRFEELSIKSSGMFINFDGEVLPW